MIFKKENPLKREDALLCIPEKNTLVQETVLDSGDIILAYQSMYKPFLIKVRKLIRANSQHTFLRKIQLDQLGVQVWSLIDGKKNVRKIIGEFASFHRLNYKEAEISVTLFLKSLGEKGLIVIREP